VAVQRGDSVLHRLIKRAKPLPVHNIEDKCTQMVDLVVQIRWHHTAVVCTLVLKPKKVCQVRANWIHDTSQVPPALFETQV
jgi:hypothetical protein